MRNIDNSKHNDNRRYVYTDEVYMRAEYPFIANWITDSARVIDLGCGNGALMHYLQEKKHVHIEGVDSSPTGVRTGLRQGLSLSLGQIDDEATYLPYRDKYFDYAICNVTVQMVMYPEVLLTQMVRIAKQVIVSFPNFAYVENRLDLLLRGVMPRPMLYGYTWYNTGHIHQLSVNDFKAWATRNNVKILDAAYLGGLGAASHVCPNLLARVAIFLCEEK